MGMSLSSPFLSFGPRPSNEPEPVGALKWGAKDSRTLRGDTGERLQRALAKSAGQPGVSPGIKFVRTGFLRRLRCTAKRAGRSKPVPALSILRGGFKMPRHKQRWVSSTQETCEPRPVYIPQPGYCSIRGCPFPSRIDGRCLQHARDAASTASTVGSGYANCRTFGMIGTEQAVDRRPMRRRPHRSTAESSKV